VVRARFLLVYLNRRPLVCTDAADMLKRRLKQAGLPAHYSPHSFRPAGITNFVENDGSLEGGQRIAVHGDKPDHEALRKNVGYRGVWKPILIPSGNSDAGIDYWMAHKEPEMFIPVYFWRAIIARKLQRVFNDAA